VKKYAVFVFEKNRIRVLGSCFLKLWRLIVIDIGFGLMFKSTILCYERHLPVCVPCLPRRMSASDN
jgi:hypothetical protein